MGKNKKKSNTFLYAGLKNKEEAPISASPGSSEKMPQVKRKLVVATTSLKNGVGSSYTGMAVANYLLKVGKEKTCFLHSGCGYVEEFLDSNIDSIYYPCNMSEVYSDYGYIVYDGGTLRDVDKNFLDRSDIKLMLCWLNEEYIRLLADFIKTRNDINNWIFVFNNIPDKKTEKAYALMEDYGVCCLPIFDASHLDKKVKTLFNKMFFNK